MAIDNVDLVAGHKTDIVQYNFGGSEGDWADPSGFPHAEAGAPGIAEGGAIIQIRPAQLLPPGRGGWNSQPKRMLRGGVLMKGDAVKAANAPISVSLRYLGNELTQTPADTTAIKLQSQVATQSYPQLGLVCSTLTASLDSTKTGHYEVITALGNAQALKTHFQRQCGRPPPNLSGIGRPMPTGNLSTPRPTLSISFSTVGSFRRRARRRRLLVICQ